MCKRGGAMIKNISFIGFLSLAVVFSANANDTDRIERLEKEIQEINLRLLRLESLLGNPGKPQESVTSGQGWRSVMNWRKLTTGIGESDVRKILGEPHRVDGGVIATWHYPNDGNVTFLSGKVQQWVEPRQ